MSHAYRSALLIALLVSFTGCNTDRTVPVAGTVKFTDGSDVAKLKGYTITCEATAARADGNKPSATGEIGADGKFQLSTNATNDGAYPGTYKVALTPPIPFGDSAPIPDAVAAKYKSLATSDLTMTVDPKSTSVTLEVEPASK
jgi:hypothetical protein